MERFSRFRRYKKATAAAAGAAAGTATATATATAPATRTATPTGTLSSAATPTQDTAFFPPTPPQRPATSAGTLTAASSSAPPPAIPKVPSIKVPSRQTDSGDARPVTAFSSPSVNSAPPLPAASSPQNWQSQPAVQSPVPPTRIPTPTSTLSQTTQQKIRGVMRTSRSPFRNLLKSSTKRSRESPPSTPATTTPAALHASPTTGLNVQMQNISFPADGTSPSSPLKETGGASISTATGAATNGIPAEERRSMQSIASSNKPPMPSFLNATPREMEQKFHDLVWLERSRINSSLTQPTGRWARVHSIQARMLDRYANIQPWEKNRVKLKVPAGHVGYINASPIVLTTTAAAHAARPPDRFIAMQGPRQNSVDHVWRMVYEQLRSPAVIVMLTETHEGMQEKCYPYFPRSPEDPPMQINERDEFGDGFRATVQCDAIEETAYGDAIELRRIVMRVHHKASQPVHDGGVGEGGAPLGVRQSEDVDMEIGGAPLQSTSSSTTAASTAGGVEIGGEEAEEKEEKDKKEKDEKDKKEGSPAAMPAEDIDMADFEDERVVYHFLYKRWPDFGVPALDDVDSFLGLMRLSAEKNADADNPRIVHCSAGVGRSGTFIALEHLQRELDAGVFEEESFSTAAQSRQGGQSEGAPDAPDDLIFRTVNQLREQRRMMVQAESQYMFIYRVLRKLWEDKYGVSAVAGGDAGPGSDNGSDTSSNVSEPAAKRLEVDPHPDRTY